MKILHINKAYSILGGIEKYIKEVTDYFRQKGNRVDVLAVNVERKIKVVKEPNGDIIELPRLFEYSSGVISLQFPNVLKKIINDYDIVNFHFPSVIGELSFLIQRRKIKTRTIVTFHNEVAKEKRFSSIYNKFISRRFLEEVDKIIVTSPNILKSSEVLRNFRDKVSIIPLGLDVKRFLPEVERFKPGVKREFPLILFVGRLAKVKGIEYLIRAMKESPGYLKIIGIGPLKKKLMKLRDSLNLRDRVKFLGYVPDKELIKHYIEADIFVLPSVYRGEGFGYVLLEAMICKTALITTELGTGTSYVNVNGETGFVVPPRDASAISRAIKELVRDRDRLSRFKENAFQRVKREFTLERMLERLEEEYRSLLER
jgi:glycosyltransferase involved in cell wall biosynthesis